MLSRVAADVVMGFHFAFLLFLAAGSLLAWRWPRVVAVHVPSVVWGLVSITVGLACPLTPLEQQLRRSAGEQGYAGGFVDHYVEGVIYPEQYTPLLRALIATAVVAGYVGLLRRTAAHGPQNDPSRHRRLWWRRCRGSEWGRGGHGRNRSISSDSAPTQAVERPATVAGTEGNSRAR